MVLSVVSSPRKWITPQDVKPFVLPISISALATVAAEGFSLANFSSFDFPWVNRSLFFSSIILSFSLLKKISRRFEIKKASPPLPKDIILSIFLYLPVKDCCVVRLVCKEWKEIAESEELWKIRCLAASFFSPSPIKSYRELYFCLSGESCSFPVTNARLKPHSKRICTLEIANNLLLSGSWDGTIGHFNIRKNQFTPLSKHNKKAYITDLKVQGDRLFSAATDGKLFIWNLEDHTASSFLSSEHAIEEIKIQDNLLAVKLGNSTCELWDISRKELLKTFSDVEEFTLESRRFFTRDDFWIYAWNCTTNTIQNMISCTSSSKITAWQAKKPFVFFGTQNGGLKKWNYITGKIRTLPQPFYSKELIYLKIHENYLIAGYIDGTLHLMALDLEIIRKIPTKERTIIEKFYSFGDLIISTSTSNKIKIQHLKREGFEKVITFQQDVSCVTSQDNTIYVGLTDGSIHCLSYPMPF